MTSNKTKGYSLGNEYNFRNAVTKQQTWEEELQQKIDDFMTPDGKEHWTHELKDTIATLIQAELQRQKTEMLEALEDYGGPKVEDAVAWDRKHRLVKSTGASLVHIKQLLKLVVDDIGQRIGEIRQ